jgi:uncharacterized protein (DUF433 family)
MLAAYNASKVLNTVLGRGVYGLPEAAKLTQLKPARVREWFRGRSSSGSKRSVFTSDYQFISDACAISFLDLIELFVAGQLREHGVSLQSLMRVRAQLKKDLATRHPFSRREVLSDGKRVFTLGLDLEGQREMVDVLNRQRVFADILLPFLKKIDYDAASKLATRWCIADGIVIDPQRSLGKPIVEEVGIKTMILESAYTANNEDAEAVADWYGVLPSHVMAAVAFERSLRG